ncbi:MAG: amidohydrolase family protein [Acidobacteriota bacterium]
MSSLRPAHVTLHAVLGLVISLGLLSGTVQAAGELPQRDHAIRAKTIYPISADPISPGVVIVQGGRIAAMGGEEVVIPEGMETVETEALLPAFVEVMSQRGLDRAFETRPDSSFIRASDALNPASLEMDDARRVGLATLLVTPPPGAALSGRGVILHPQGLEIDSMILRDDAYMSLSLQPRGGVSRMGHLARLRKILSDGRRELEEREKRDGRRRHHRSDEIPPEKQALYSLLEGEIPALVDCNTAADVATAFALAREYGFEVTPVIEPECWRAIELLAVNRVTAIIGPRLTTWEILPDGTRHHVDLPSLLHEAGVPFCMSTDPRELAAQHPWYLAARCVRSGVPEDVALAAVTRNPAELLGFEGSKGVIQVGADADLVLLSDQPFSGRAFVDSLLIKGTRVYHRDADTKLNRLFGRAHEPPMLVIESDHPEDPRTEDWEQLEHDLQALGPSPGEADIRWPAPISPPKEPHTHDHGEDK